jgi:hypothetical protein
MICKPKQNGGLGISDFKLQNEALLLNHLHKFFNRADLPWVKLMWNSIQMGYLMLLNYVHLSGGVMC